MSAAAFDDQLQAIELLQSRFRATPRFNQLGLLQEFLPETLHGQIAVDPAEFLGRASGLIRAGVTAQLSWARKETRLGIGIETPIAHAFVDRLLGDARTPAESRLQVTPVEWGILSFLALRLLGTVARLLPDAGGPLDLSLDRLGADPFDARDLGPIITIRWGMRVGEIAGAVRLWVPERAILAGESVGASEGASLWMLHAGSISLPRGVESLRLGRVLPIDAANLTGTPDSPEGTMRLLSSELGRHTFHEAVIEPDTRGTTARVISPRLQEAAASGRPRAPVLDVILGTAMLAANDIATGLMVQLDRHPQARVQLDFRGRTVARGELVVIDTELGVRVCELHTDSDQAG